MVRSVARVVVVAALVALLGGCRVDLDVTVEVAPDGTGRVVLVATTDADVVEQAPGLAQDLRFDDLRDAGWTVDGPEVTDEGGITVTLSHEFSSPAEATSILAGLNGAAGPFQGVSLARTEDGPDVTFTLGGVGRVDSGLATFTDPALLAAVGGVAPYAAEIAAANLSPNQAVGITFTAELPGSVEESSADPEADGLTWTIPLDGSTVQLSATTSLATGTDGAWSVVASVFLAALVVWLVASAAFVYFVVRARQRRTRARLMRGLPPPSL